MTQLYRGQGKVFIALVTAGIVGAGKFLGNVTALTLSPEVEKIEHKESTSGKRAVDKTLITSRKMTFAATLEDFSAATMATAFQGSKTVISLGTVTGEILPAALVAGDFVALANVDASTIVLSDSSATPAILTAGTHYSVESAKHGSLQILDIATFTQPLKAAYAFGAAEKVDILSGSAKTYELRFEGLNTAEDDKAVLVKARIQLEPGKQLSLIGDEFANYEISGDVLYTGGRFADVIFVD